MKQSRRKYLSTLLFLDHRAKSTFKENPTAVTCNKIPVEIELAANFPLGKDYQIEKLIGTGSYGTVVLARHEPSGKKVAVKKISNIF